MKHNKYYLVFISLVLTSITEIHAQLCQNSLDSVYGLNSITGSGSGQILGVNVVNAGTALIGSPATSSANANALGYSKATNLFYFFNQTGGGATEFVSFNPLTGIKLPLAIPSSPAFPTAVAGKIRSGTVNVAGNAYYTIFPGATTAMGFPVTGPAFYYYNIPGNNWVRITQSFKDISGNTVNEIKNLNSGDMAFDGFGRLWMVCSSNTNYALYRINGPLPTTAVASITVDTIIASKPTPAGVSITGIAFNYSGDLFLTTGSGGGAGNNILYKMTMVASPLTTIGTLPNGAGDDLASCIHPFVILPVTYFQFNLSFNNNAVKLLWKTDEANDVLGYDIEYSNNAIQWEKIAFAVKNGVPESKLNVYFHYNYQSGNNYYRIAQLSNSGEKRYSAVQRVVVNSNDKVNISINPANNTLTISGKYLLSNYIVQVFDNTGRLIFSGIPEKISQAIDISNLQKGMYFVRLLTSTQKYNSETYKFMKY